MPHRLVAITLVSLLVTSCSSVPEPTPAAGSEVPAWTQHSSGLRHVRGRRSFVGIGAKRGRYAQALLAHGARTQASQALSQLLAPFLNAALDPWVKAAANPEELMVAPVLRAWIQGSLAHVGDPEMHSDESTGSAVARVELDLDDVLATYDQLPELAPVRQHYSGSSQPLIDLFDTRASAP